MPERGQRLLGKRMYKQLFFCCILLAPVLVYSADLASPPAAQIQSVSDATDTNAPDSEDGYEQRGYEAYCSRDFDSAVKTFESWTAAEPRNPTACVWLAKALAYQSASKIRGGKSRISMIGEGRHMHELYEKALELDSNHYQARLGKAIYLRMAPAAFGGSKKEAHEIFEQLLKEQPDNPYVLHAYAILLEQENKVDEAISRIQRVIAFSRKHEPDPELRLKLAECYYHVGRMLWEYHKDAVSARPYLEKAATDWDFMPEAAALLGDIARERGENAVAIAWYSRAYKNAEQNNDERTLKVAERALKKYKVNPGQPEMADAKK